jgi:hypothetical protein
MAANFKDRSTGLLVFGILEIVLGCLAALMVPLMILGQVMSAQVAGERPPLAQIIPAVIFYAIYSAALITLGIGSCKARRWARALTLVVAWSWLAIGVLSIGMMAFFLPSVLAVQQPEGPSMPTEARTIVMAVSMVFMSILFIVIPGVLVAFYRSPHVRATCEARDPLPRWTDVCPLPVLGLSLWLAFGALTLLTLPLSTRGVLPLFGVLLSGSFGSLACVMLAAVWGYCAWGTYRLRPVAWWIVLVTVCVFTASAIITFSRVDLMEVYRLMGYPEHQLELMGQYSFMQGKAMVYFSVAAAIPMVVFLAFVKRYFRTPTHYP